MASWVLEGFGSPLIVRCTAHTAVVLQQAQDEVVPQLSATCAGGVPWRVVRPGKALT
jgi:hypothetical protein